MSPNSYDGRSRYASQIYFHLGALQNIFKTLQQILRHFQMAQIPPKFTQYFNVAWITHCEYDAWCRTPDGHTYVKVQKVKRLVDCRTRDKEF